MTLNVNGQNYDIIVPADMPLLWVLRDIIGLTGTKYGCGIGLCGSCVVLADNQAIRSCVTPASGAIGKKIITIEGLSSDNSHPVQKAWIAGGVSQCGWCQPGQIMSAAALLINNPNPGDKDIDTAMHENICRCGTYNRIRDAVKLAAKG